MENKIDKCKDCKYFKASCFKAARSGNCCHPKYEGNEYYPSGYPTGNNTHACKDFVDIHKSSKRQVEIIDSYAEAMYGDLISII